MTDRFKFRIWDEKEKRFIDHPQINPLFGCVCGYENSAYPLQIEQCTGLSDKIGNLIYEGDIVSDGYVKRTVVWNGWYWNAKAEANCPLDDITCCIVEIVGNIHEQKDVK